MQAKLCDINPLPLYVPCAAHSLNLIGVCAVESCVEATHFFSLVQKLFTLFSASTSRWGILVQYLEGEKRVLKCLSDMRWSAVLKLLKHCQKDTIKFELLFYILCKILNSEHADTQQEANGLHISLYLTWTLFSWLYFGTSFWKGSTELAWLFKVLKLSEEQLSNCYSHSRTSCQREL